MVRGFYLLALVAFVKVYAQDADPPPSSEPCPAGTWSTTGYFPGCEPCDYGYYQPDIGSTECIECDEVDGMTTAHTRSTSAEDCKAPCAAGFYSPDGYEPCQSCHKGTYSNLQISTMCMACPEYTTTEDDGATSEDDCIIEACQAGYWAPEGFDGQEASDDHCRPCPIGTYQPERQMSGCIDCGDGTITLELGSTAADQCHAQCEPGTSSRSGIEPCDECALGEYQPDPGMTNCIRCPDDLTTLFMGSTRQTQCRDEENMCPAGQYSETGYLPCEQCDFGTYQPSEGLRYCMRCPHGADTDVRGAVAESQCIGRCRPGQYSSNGQTPCEMCPLNTYAPGSANTECSDCPDGTGTETLGSRSLNDCKDVCTAGSYSPNGIQECDPCPMGTYASNEGQTSCDDCPEGTSTFETGATGSEFCTRFLCDSGQWSSTGFEPCTDCSIGFYQDSFGATGCFACPRGTTTNGPASTTIDDCIAQCPPGSFSSNGYTPCTQCPFGEYQPGTGSLNCIPCSDGYTTSVRGATSSTQCVEDNSVDRDPHFMLSSHMTGHHMCFDFDGFEDEVMLLVQDGDITINGRLFETEDSTPEVPQSYFSDIAMMLGDHEIICAHDFIKIDDDVYGWDQIIDHNYNNIEVQSSATNSTTVIINTNTTFMVTRAYGKAVGFFLGLYILRSQGLSENSEGVIGQFVRTDFAADINNDAEGATGMLFFNDNRHDPVRVTNVRRYNKVAQAMIPCWLYKPAVGQPDLLLGPREQYIMPELESKEQKQFQRSGENSWWPF